MPPMFGKIWNQGKDLVSSITGSGKDSEVAHDSTTEAHLLPIDNDSDVEEVVSNPNSKKRKVATAVQIPRKRPDTRSGNERRLTGDFEHRTDAVPIGIPQQSDTFEAFEEARRVGAGDRMFRNKPGASGRSWKPLNTLGDGSLQASNGMIRRPVPKRAQANGTVIAPRGTIARGDGFTAPERGGPATKKRKIQNIPDADPESDPIEPSDGDDDLDVPKVISVNGVPRKNAHNARTQTMVAPRTAPFESNESRTVDGIIRQDQPKPRRKLANGYRSSQSSSRASPVNMTNGHSTRLSPQVIVLEDTSQEVSQHHAKPASSSAGTDLPDPKALGNGVFDISEPKQRRQSEDSVKYSHTHTKSQMPPPSINGGHAHPAQQPSNQQRKRRQIRSDDGQDDRPQRTGDLTDRYTRGKAQRRSEENDRHKFVRDDSASQQPTNGTTSQKSRMKATSGQTRAESRPARESLGSADELTGPTTVGSVSPQKRPSGIKDARPQTAESRSSRSKSPSDLKPTPFTTTERLNNVLSRSKTNGRTTGVRPDDALVVPLRNFYSTSCCLTEGDIAMRYDPTSNDLTIEHDGVPVAVPEGKRCVQVGATEVSHVVTDNTSPVIYLRGSAGAISNGHICIEFQYTTDKYWFLKRLLKMCSIGPTWDDEKSANGVRKIFDHQMKGLKVSHKKRMEKLAKEQALARGQAISDRIEAKKLRKRPDDDEDEIKYESAEPERTYRRKDMMGKNIEDDDELQSRAKLPKILENSRFFDDTTPRRSTRRSTANNQKAPSPPEVQRWTHMNKLERWPHSVVYPNEGAGRVTVDFQDLERLDEGEFLNDNVISFALRRIEERMAPEHKERVHFFNSFFYTALTTKNGKKAFNYDAVKRWTKSKDLLGCDYVVVPINIDLHWFVAIICNLPNLSRKLAGLDEDEEEAKDEDVVAEDGQEIPSDAVEPPNAADVEQTAGETPDNAKEMRHLSLSDDEGAPQNSHPEAENGSPIGPQDDAPADAESPPNVKKGTTSTGRKGKIKRGPPSYDQDKPAILTLDSFGASHTAQIRYLKDYLQAEAEAKRGIEVDVGQLQGANIKDPGIPTQQNFCDCGVYLVGYVEQFAKDPRAFATKALKRTLGREGEFADFDPSQKRNEIREELLKLQTEQELEHKAKKAGKKAAAVKGGDQTTTSAAATPKPESKPASKAPSPAKDAGKLDGSPAAPTLPPRAQATPSRKPTGAVETTAQPQASQGNDLEYTPPRALESPSRFPGIGPPPAQPLQPSSSQEEMLDDPANHTTFDQPNADESEQPNPLLDTLSAAVRRSSQQAELSLVAQLQEAAGQQAEDVEAVPDDDEDDDGPDIVRNEDVIDLGDEDDEPVQRSEIPDSQEQRPRMGRGSLLKQWAGKRTTFD